MNTSDNLEFDIKKIEEYLKNNLDKSELENFDIPDPEKIKEIFEQVYEEEHEKFEEIKKQTLIISLVGNVNAGKSMTINALTGKRYADVKARAGWTKEVSLYPLEEKVLIADTPGLQDVNEQVSKKATDFIEKDADVILFFINASVGLTKEEKNAFNKITSLEREIIVVLNKIDVLDEDELNDTIEQIEEELNTKPIPISAKRATNIDKLNNKIIEILNKQGKDLLFAKVSRYKESTVNKWIVTATASASAIGAMPIPGADIVPLTGLQVGLALKIAHIWDCKVSKNDVMQLLTAGPVGKAAQGSARFAIEALKVGVKNNAKWAVAVLKAVGWIPGGQPIEIAICAICATIAGATTYAFGRSCNEYYKNGMAMDLGEFGEVFKKYLDEHSKNRAKDKS